jgi:hypothetical protein
LSVREAGWIAEKIRRRSYLTIFQDGVAKKFKITVVDEVKEYLVIQIDTLTNGDIKLTQPKPLESLLEEYADRLSTKLQRVHGEDAVAELSAMDKTEYLHLLGSLIYTTKSKPELSTAVSFSVTYAAKPTVGAWAVLTGDEEAAEISRE